MESNHKKVWKLEVSNHELTIIQIAVERFVERYEGNAFTALELISTLDELRTYKYIGE